MNHSLLRVIHPGGPLQGSVDLPASKSISNRVLIIRRLCSPGFDVGNLSDADDTITLLRLLQKAHNLEDAGAGGTTFRFLLALRALQQHQGVLTGSARLCERPVRILVDILREMGASIDYLERDGFPPLQLNGGELKGGAYTLDAGVSSQFISALMLIGPAVPGGLILHRAGRPVSGSYIELTAAVMREFGIDVTMTDHTIVVSESTYQPCSFVVGADWSAAMFFYAFAALSPGTSLLLKGLTLKDQQADAKLALWMEDWGVTSVQMENGVQIQSSGIPHREFEYDLLNNPDLAQGFAVMAAVAGRKIELTGLSTLKDKETDRLQALKSELEKAGAIVVITPDSLSVMKGLEKAAISGLAFETYDDHRMVMALSLLASTGEELTLSDARPVSKSFPGFFNQLKLIGFVLS